VLRGLRVVGVLMVLAGLGLVADGITGLVVTSHEQVATTTELEAYNARLTKNVLLVVGGVLACAAGSQAWRAARSTGSPSRLGCVLLVGGYLLVAAGLAVLSRYDSVGGFSVGFGLQVVGAVAVGVGGSAVRRERGTPPSHEPSGH
jgi:peptidoglycan/LPS O-acetylase OafA/YrhL